MIPYKIKIDIEGQREITSNITLSVGDVEGYGLVLEFYRSGKPYDITGYNLSVSAMPSGATLPIPDVGTVEGGRGYYLIKPSMYAYAGSMRLEIILSDGRSSTVTKVIHFPVRSGFSSFGGSIVEEKDFTVLQELISKAQIAISQAETVVRLSDETKTFAEEARVNAQMVMDAIKTYGSVVKNAYVLDGKLYIEINDGETFVAGYVKGDKGDTGNSGVYIGTEEPQDPEAKVWIDPTGHDGMRELINILGKLKYTNGDVAVNLSDYATKGELDGKAPSTHKHSASDITSGSLPVARGGHGGTSVAKAQENLGLACVKTGGTGEAYTATIPGITELKTGVKVRIEPHVTCTTPYPTLNVNNLGDADIYIKLAGRGWGDVANEAGWLETGCSYELTYSEFDDGWIANVIFIDLDESKALMNVLQPKHGGTGRESFPDGQFLVGSLSGGIATKTPAQALSALGKLTGSYTGNGSARTIEIGGVGNVLAIWGRTYSVIVTPKGCVYGDDEFASGFDSSMIQFDDGKLKIYYSRSVYNDNGDIYHYQVL